CDLRNGQGWRRGDWSDQAWKRLENHGDCGSAWLAALGEHTRREPSRSALGAALLRLLIEAKPDNLIGDRAYDSDPLDDELRQDGIEMIAPHRSNRRKSATQDRRRLRRYARRWLVETVLRLNSMAAPPSPALGILSEELPWLRATRLPRCPQAIFR